MAVFLVSKIHLLGGCCILLSLLLIVDIMMMTQRCYSSSRSNSYSNSMARRSFCHFLRQHGDNHHNHNHTHTHIHTRRSNNTVTVPSQRPTIYSCRPNMTATRTRTTTTTTIRWFGDISSSSSSIDRAFEGVSEEVSKRIQYHAHQPQTAVSLKTLLQTGRGEFLHKTYKNLEEEDNQRGATGKVLIQVSIIVWVLLLLCVWGHNKLFVCLLVSKPTFRISILDSMIETHFMCVCLFVGVFPHGCVPSSLYRLPVFYAVSFPFDWLIGFKIWSVSPT